MKVWITKCVLTKGILEEEAVITTTDSNMIRTNRKRPKYFYGERKDWHMTKESAIQRAEEMRKKKIISLKKQIEKLDKMKFE